MRSSLEQPVSVDANAKPFGEQPSANEEGFLSLEDLKPRGVWKNKEGERIRIKKIDPPVYFDSSTGRDVFLGSPEDLLNKLREGRYVAEPMPHQEEETHPSLEAEIGTLDTAIETTLEGIENKRKELVAALEQARAEAEKTDSQAIALRLKDIEEQVAQELQRVNEASEDDDALDEALEDKEPTHEDVTAKQGRQQLLIVTLQSFESLTQEVQGFATALAALSQERNRGEEEGAAPTGSSEGTGDAPEKKRRRRKGGSGGDGGDGEDEERETKKLGEDRRKARQNKRGVSPEPEQEGSLNDRSRAALLRARTEARPAVPETPPQEEQAPSEDWRVELAKFLERPEGREVIIMYRTIITGEWRKFLEMLDEAKMNISLYQKIDLWERDARLFPKVRNSILHDLQEKRNVPANEGQSILAAILRELDEEFQARRTKQNSTTK